MPIAPQPRFEFAGFYQATAAHLRSYLTRLLGNRSDAEDVVHDAYTDIYPALLADRVQKPEAFLFTAAKRLAFRRLRHRHMAATAVVEPAALDRHCTTTAGVTETVMARQELAVFRAAVEQLPPRCRAVFLLRKLELLPHQEIARRLGITVPTVDKQLARALRLLRAAMHDAGVAAPGVRTVAREERA